MEKGQTRLCIWAAVALTVLSASTLSSCRHAPDEVQVRHAIEATTQAAEDTNASGVVAPLSDDFDGNGGALDRRALGSMVRLFRLRGERIKVNLGPIDMERRGQRLVATFMLTLRGGNHLLPEQMGVYRVESAWREDDGHWRCYSATWKRAL